MGYKQIDFDSIDSTSSYIKRNYQNLDNLTFVSALFQSNGRGRTNRKWDSTSNNNLLFSLLIKDSKIIENYRKLSLISAVSIYKVLRSINIDNVMIKWPNDVYVDNKKICGILLEGISYDNKIQAIIIGIGLNVNETNFDSYNLNDATSIFNVTNIKYNLNEIKEKVYETLIEEINKNDDSYLKIAKENNYLLNKEVYALIDNNKVKVKVIDINNDNSLKVIYNGKTINILSGEITFHIN